MKKLLQIWMFVICATITGVAQTDSCVITSLPQFWDFEANNTGGTSSRPLPTCWTSVASPSSSGGAPHVNSYAGMTYNGSYSLNFWQSRGWYVVLPLLADSLQANDLDLSFWWKVSGKWNTCTSSALTVGVMTDPADVSTFTALQTLTTTDTLFHFVDVSLSTYSDTGKYIAFFDATPVGASGESDIYIDDLSLEYAPACPRPTDLTLVNLESRTADVVWTSNADSTDYVVFYRAVTNPTVWFSDTVVGTAYTLQDLIPNTTYEVYVIALCSPWSQSSRITFRTDCAPDIIAVSQTWGFEEPTDYYHAPLCWLRYLAGASVSSPPYVSSYQSIFQNHSLYFFSSSGHIAIMPYVNPDYLDIRALQISFYVFNNYGDENPNATIEVGVMTNPTDPSTFTTIQIIDSIGMDVQFVTIPFYNYLGEGTYIAFRDNNPYPTAANPNTYYSIYIDNLTIDYCDSLPCAVPTQAIISAVTDTSAVVSWSDIQPDPKPYMVYYKSSTDDVWQTDTVLPGVYSHTFHQLHYATAYDCYVAAICNPTVPSNTTHFVTECYKITTVPVSWGFEDNEIDEVGLPLCWNKISDTDYPHVSSAGSFNSGYALRFKSECTAILPVIDPDFVQIPDLTLSFKAKVNNSNNHNMLEVGVMQDPMDTSMFVTLQTIENVSTTFQSFQIPMTSYSGSGTYIAIRHSGGNNTYSLVDDVTLQYTNPIDGISEYLLSTCPVFLYPNPAREYVDVRVTDPDIGILGVEVYDIYGKVVRTVVGANDYSTLQTTRITLSGFSAGVYTVRIRTDKGFVTKKLVKQ